MELTDGPPLEKTESPRRGRARQPKPLAAGPAGGGLALQVDVVPLGGQRHGLFFGIAHHFFNEDSHGLINILVLLD